MIKLTTKKERKWFSVRYNRDLVRYNQEMIQYNHLGPNRHGENVRYKREFVITEFVITEFDCINKKISF